MNAKLGSNLFSALPLGGVRQKFPALVVYKPMYIPPAQMQDNMRVESNLALPAPVCQPLNVYTGAKFPGEFEPLAFASNSDPSGASELALSH